MIPYTLPVAMEECAAAMRAGAWERVAALADTLDRLATGNDVAVLSAALWYAEHGMHVFPLQPGDKVPYPRTRGFKDATTDADKVREWWTRWPDSNVGIATGHVVDVIDFDGLGGHQSWGRAFPDDENRWGGAEVLATVSTPRVGGLHVYVPALPGQGNGANLFPGVDYRGLGGYVVAPPSIRPDGKYVFLRPLHLEGRP